MSRLIDADALKEKAFFHEMDNVSYVEEEDIDNAPTVDAVQVVRCKDCVHCSENGGKDCPVEKHHPIQMNGFCHFGERRSE